MANPTISTLPTAPSRDQDQTTFRINADAFVGAQENFVTEVNNFGSWANDQVIVIEGVGTGFQGAWSDQTGTAVKPYSVVHNNSVWVLLNNLADITTSEPTDVNTDWFKTTSGSIEIETGPAGSVFVGNGSGNSDDSDNRNVAIGNNTLNVNSSGVFNVAAGNGALHLNTASGNTALGYFAMNSNSSGFDNVAIGRNSLQLNTTGDFNIAIGPDALLSNTTANNNLAIGSNALDNNTTGNSNVAIGNGSLSNNITSSANIAIGLNALQSNNGGVNNIGIGVDSLDNVATGQRNVAIGRGAGGTLTTGSNNTLIGSTADVSSTSNNCIVIGDAQTAVGDNQLNIGGIITGDLSTGVVSIPNGRFSTTDGDINISSSLNSTVGTFEFTGTAPDSFISLDATNAASEVLVGNNNGSFVVQTAGSSFSNKMVIDSNGDVGIGSSSIPNIKSFIYDNTTATTDVCLLQQDNASSTNRVLRIENDGTGLSLLINQGDSQFNDSVGIGITPSSNKLHWSGGSYSQVSVGEGALYADGGGGAVIHGRGSSFDFTLLNNTGQSALKVPTNTRNVQFDGNVGVGGVPVTGTALNLGDGLTNFSGGVIRSIQNNTVTQSHMVIVNANGQVGGIVSSGTATSFNTTSDPRLKRFVTPSTEDYWQKILDAKGFFFWRSDVDKLAESVPEVYNPDGSINEQIALENGLVKVNGFDAHKCIDLGLDAGVEGKGPRFKEDGITPYQIGEVYDREEIPEIIEIREILDNEGNGTGVTEPIVIQEAQVIEHKVTPAGVDQSKFVPYLIDKIAKQDDIIEELTNTLTNIQTKVSKLEGS